MIGSADPLNAGSTNYQQHLTNAELMNRLGKRSVEAGVGPLYFHNHASSFNAKVMDNGVLKPMWQVLIERTDPRYVKSQIDIGWAVSGGADVAALVNTYPNRISSFHVKDVVNPQPNSATSSLRALGDGDINFAPIFVAAKNRVKLYHYEYDPVAIGATAASTRSSPRQELRGPQGRPGRSAGHHKPTFTSVPAGTAAANNVVPVTVTNKGDAAPRSRACRSPRRRTTAATRRVTTSRSSRKLLRHRQRRSARGRQGRVDDPATPDVNEAAPAVPAGTCTVNVGFKPSARTTCRSPASCWPPPLMTRGRRSCWSPRAPATLLAPWAATSRPCWR